MPSQSFIQQDKIGKKFEALVKPHLSAMGLEAISTSNQRYRHKKGRDFVVKIKNPDGTYKRDERGYVIQCGIELKYDLKSETTQNICIDVDSINKSTSAIWILGLPESSQIHLYAAFLSDLAPFTFQYIKDHPECLKASGEYREPNPMIPKPVLITQPWIRKFKTINA